ncbi:hypothetical protein [Xenorhabdus indica]|uniref:hypothetical protein n=1 Tax=Xenorhabdus indica TaxID=333964 RepID=UPI001656BF60|nr:hypothetical protein [Xenorhabdus indica]MBC8947056.1 hypothetical protein [Xenorhabdus indica]
MLTEKENKKLNKCLFHCVDISADISQCSSEGLELRGILNKKIKSNKAIDIDVHDFSKLPCSYPVIENTFKTEETIDVLRVFCIDHGYDAQSLYEREGVSYFSVFASVVDFIRYFACIKCDEVNRFIDKIDGKTISYFMISFPMDIVKV